MLHYHMKNNEPFVETPPEDKVEMGKETPLIEYEGEL